MTRRLSIRDVEEVERAEGGFPAALLRVLAAVAGKDGEVSTSEYACLVKAANAMAEGAPDPSLPTAVAMRALSEPESLDKALTALREAAKGKDKEAGGQPSTRPSHCSVSKGTRPGTCSPCSPRRWTSSATPPQRGSPPRCGREGCWTRRLSLQEYLLACIAEGHKVLKARAWHGDPKVDIDEPSFIRWGRPFGTE